METESGEFDYPAIKKRKVTIESVIGKDRESVEPVYATFTNGTPALKGALKGNVHQNNSSNVRLRNQRLMTVETPWMKYIGGSQRITKDSVYIGVLDKNTGNMKLVETSPFTLRPKIGSKEEVEVKMNDNMTYQEKQEIMLSRFGSKRANQLMRQRKLYQITSEGMSEALQQASSNIEVKEESVDIATDTQCDYLALLPPSNREAKTPEEVYKLEYIAPDYFLAHFEDTARKYLAGEVEFEANKYSNLMRVMVSLAKFENDEESQVRSVCLALFAEYMIRFTRLKNRELKKPNALEGCPAKVKHHIFDTYAKGRERILSMEDKDSALCLILVLGLIGCKYEVAISTVMESLHINLKKLHLLMRAIGATFIKDDFSFRLKIPLTKISKPHSHKRMAKGIR